MDPRRGSSKARESHRQGPFSVALSAPWRRCLGLMETKSCFRHGPCAAAGSSLVLLHSLPALFGLIRLLLPISNSLHDCINTAPAPLPLPITSFLWTKVPVFCDNFRHVFTLFLPVCGGPKRATEALSNYRCLKIQKHIAVVLRLVSGYDITNFPIVLNKAPWDKVNVLTRSSAYFGTNRKFELVAPNWLVKLKIIFKKYFSESVCSLSNYLSPSTLFFRPHVSQWLS